MFLALLGACGAPEPLSTNQVLDLIERESGGTGEVFEQPIRVRRENGTFDHVAVYIVHKPDGTRSVIDSNGQLYEPTLEDFLENNNLFTSRDTITVPRDFPNTEPSRPSEAVSMPGHVTSTEWLWWLGGGSLGVIAAACGFLWRRSRRRSRGGGQATVLED